MRRVARVRGLRRIPINIHRRIIGMPTAKMRQRIAAKNHLAGPAGVSKTGPPLDKDPDIPWPDEFKYAYAISMSVRPERAAGLKARLGKWAKRVSIWTATNGYTINRSVWAKSGKISFGCTLGRGQLGCYDSHVRIWTHIVERKLPMALILEDDANIRYRRDVYNRIRASFDELKSRKISWEIMFIGLGSPSRRKQVGNPPAKRIARYHGCQGLFAYVLTFAGAKKLLSRAKPYRLPVDVLVAEMIDSNALRGFGMHPSLCYVVPVRSDTGGIK